MINSKIIKISAVLQVSAGTGSFTPKYIENGDYDATLRCSTGETITGRELESTLNDCNALGLSPKKISDLCVQPFRWKTTFCEPEKSNRNIHLEPKWSKLY